MAEEAGLPSASTTDDARRGPGPGAASGAAELAAQREEVRHLTRLAAVEAKLAKWESMLAYYSELFPGVVHAAEAAKALMWMPPMVIPTQEGVEAGTPCMRPALPCPALPRHRHRPLRQPPPRPLLPPPTAEDPRLLSM